MKIIYEKIIRRRKKMEEENKNIEKMIKLRIRTLTTDDDITEFFEFHQSLEELKLTIN